MPENENICRNCGRAYSTDDQLLIEVDGEPKLIHKIEWRGILSYSNLCKDWLRMTLRVIQDCQHMYPNYMEPIELKIIN